MKQPLPKIDKQWTLFLDRDGVLNTDNIHGYILNWEEFKFCKGVPDALALCSSMFGRIVLVTNQRGIGKGLMSIADLENIHDNMMQVIEDAGGRIDLLLHCSAMDNSHPNRKPNPGMAFEAKKQFPEIDFTRSIMVGNTSGDMEFGRNINAFNVYIHTREDKIPKPATIDAQFDTLLDLAKALHSN
jgi:histidinol phosphatase-like enzyme